VSTTRHIWISRGQSGLLRAKRYFAGGNHVDFPKANLGYLSNLTAHHATRGQRSEIVIYDVDLGPAERREPISHRLLQRLAHAAVQLLMHIENRFAR
jgi:hypothetical protein